MKTFECRVTTMASSGVLIFLSVLLAAQPVHAQTLNVLHSFVRPAAYPHASLVKGKDGAFYGTTAGGGDSDRGTVFRLDSVGNVNVLHSFQGTDGAGPVAGLIQATDGSFYGTTGAGGINGCVGGCGTVFKMDSSGNLTTLYSFTGGADGGYPYAGVIQASDGNFYGTAYGLGTGSNFGTVFRMDSSGKLTTIYRFTGGTDGQGPVASLIQAADGNFYGTTDWGANGWGTIFRVDFAGNLTTLHSFHIGDGVNPLTSLVQATDGNFYGTTSQFSDGDAGTIFKMDASGNVTTLYTFTGGADGQSPNTLLQSSDGDFYGTTPGAGSAGFGTVFKMSSVGKLTTLYSFTGGRDGSYPQAALVQATDGTFFGTTEFGGEGTGEGTVFRVDSLGNLTTFGFGGGDGAFPGASLVQGTDGNFYGTTTTGGGAGNSGTVFKLDSSGNLTTLHRFDGADGAFPNGSLIQATDGNFYGTTASGGASGYDGTVFRMDSSGNLTTLASFTGGLDGSDPQAGLIQATDGSFYGTTRFGGGATGDGTIFRMDSSGTLTTLHGFAGTDGAYPNASLIQGGDGNFYGTTSVGGANGYGTVFKTDAAGNVTTLYSFADGLDGASPQAGLIQAADGNFYGTTSGEDGSDAGGQSTVFKTDSLGNLTTLYRFTGGSDGYSPVAGLIQARDGNFYGTTAGGGANNNGTVFRIDSSGGLTTLHSFMSLSDGRYPAASLLQASDGHFYGTTSDGGSRGGGAVFEIDAPSRGRRGGIKPVPIAPPVPVKKTDLVR